MQRTHWRWSWVRQGRQQADPRHTRPPPHQQLHRLPAGRGCWKRKDANSNIGWFLKPCFATRDAHDKGEGVEDPPKEPLKGEVRRSNKSSAPFCKRIILGKSQQRQKVCWRLVSKANNLSHQLSTPLRKATKARKAMREPAMLPTRKTAWQRDLWRKDCDTGWRWQHLACPHWLHWTWVHNQTGGLQGQPCRDTNQEHGEWGG